MARKTDTAGRIIEAAMKLFEARGYTQTALPDIAEEAGLPLSKLYEAFPGKAAILDAFARRIDAKVLDQDFGFGPEESPRDRLFEVMMSRFDALRPYRGAVERLMADARRDPLLALQSISQLRTSMRWMLVAAGLDGDGVRQFLRTKGAIGLHLAALRVFVRDDSADLSRTMAELDSYLRRIEGFLGLLRNRRRARPETDAAAADDSEGTTAAG